jgi:CrcB protein
MSAVWFILAAAGGASVRTLALSNLNRPAFPFGTLVVNAAGSFALGVVAGWSEFLALVFGVALLGSLTTFSTFTVETTALWLEHRRALAATYALATTAAAVGAAWAGLAIS